MKRTMLKHKRAEILHKGMFHKVRRIVCSCGWLSLWHYSSRANNEEFRQHVAAEKKTAEVNP